METAVVGVGIEINANLFDIFQSIDVGDTVGSGIVLNLQVPLLMPDGIK